MRPLLYILPMLLSSVAFAQTTNIVRTLAPWPEGAATGKENWTELVDCVKEGFNNGTNNLNACEVIAWCVKLDHLDCPPRLSEEAIVMINCIAPGRTNSWALGYAGRMPSGPIIARSWSLFDYPPPLTNFIRFAARPDGEQIASFIKATNFGYNDFYPDRRVLDVVLYRESEIIAAALKAGLPEREKMARHSAYLKSIPY